MQFQIGITFCFVYMKISLLLHYGTFNFDYGMEKDCEVIIKSIYFVKFSENSKNIYYLFAFLFYLLHRQCYQCYILLKQPTLCMLTRAFCCRHVSHCFTSGFLCLRKKNTPVWYFTLVSQTKAKFKPVWVSLTRSNVNAHNEFTLCWSEILNWIEISNLCEFTSGLKLTCFKNTMFIVYVDLKMVPKLGKKCYEFFKLVNIFLILSFRKFTGGYSHL